MGKKTPRQKARTRNRKRVARDHGPQTKARRQALVRGATTRQRQERKERKAAEKAAARQEALTRVRAGLPALRGQKIRSAVTTSASRRRRQSR